MNPLKKLLPGCSAMAIAGIFLLASCSEDTLPVKLVYPDDPVVGTGLQDDPYDVFAASRRARTGTTSWVKGLVVGAVKSGVAEISGSNDIVWGADASGINAQTLVLADDLSERDLLKCLVVDFSDVSTGLVSNLNLVDNKENIGKEVLVYGKLSDQTLGCDGMTGMQQAYLNNIAIPALAAENPIGLSALTLVDKVYTGFNSASNGTIYSEKGWTNVPTKGLNYFKGETDGENSYVYVSTSGATVGKTIEAWIATPAFRAESKKAFLFDCLLENPDESTSLEAYVWVEDIESGEFEAIPALAEPITTTDGEWSREVRLTIDDKYDGQVVYVGLKYTTTVGEIEQRCCLDNIKYGGQVILFKETFGDMGAFKGENYYDYSAFPYLDNPASIYHPTSINGKIDAIMIKWSYTDNCFFAGQTLWWRWVSGPHEFYIDLSDYIPGKTNGFSYLRMSLDASSFDIGTAIKLSDFDIYCDDKKVDAPSDALGNLVMTSLDFELPTTSFSRFTIKWTSDASKAIAIIRNITIYGE